MDCYDDRILVSNNCAGVDAEILRLSRNIDCSYSEWMKNIILLLLPGLKELTSELLRADNPGYTLLHFEQFLGC